MTYAFTYMGFFPIPHVATSLLTLVQEHIDENAILAGGYLRDLRVHNKAGCDIDIFVYAGGLLGPNGAGKKIDKFFDVLAITDVDIHPFVDQANMPGWDTLALAKFEFLGMKVDLIVIDKPVSGDWYKNRVNFGINQIWFDGKNIYEGSSFHKDLSAKTITLIHSNSQREVARNFNKKDRLLERAEWQGWTFKCALTDAQMSSLPQGMIPTSLHKDDSW